MPPIREFSEDIALVIGGEAGRGIQTVEQLLTIALKLSGYHIFATKEYMSRIRGGSNSTQIRIASRPVSAGLGRIDLLLPLDQKALERLRPGLRPESVILGDAEVLSGAEDLIHIPFGQLAEQAGERRAANTVAVGVLLGLVGQGLEPLLAALEQQFADLDRSVIDANLKAARSGFEAGRNLVGEGRLALCLQPTAAVANDLFLTGSEAVAYGAIAGGCNFVSSYPMSPATGALLVLARHARECGIVVEQAEDEIAASNMALGAWYAGARALVTTSGGGFDLMTESLSLAGMTETPLVIHLGQRPGPATGLPTRTEQGDLEMALYSGHGEYPRILLAPGSHEQAFALSRQAFDLADRFQVPVIVLTDQYLLDALTNLPALDLEPLPVTGYTIETGADYRRYAIAEDGISPRGIPGRGQGLVCVDSDEHDEDGHITEDLALRIRMVDKRLRKLVAMTEAALPPELDGHPHADTLVVTWGSTCQIVREALRRLHEHDLAMLHFPQIYPLPKQTGDLLARPRHLIVVENNATGQFAGLLQRHTGRRADHRILKYDGLPFTVEELTKTLRGLLDRYRPDPMECCDECD